MIKKTQQRIIDQILKKLNKMKAEEKTIIKYKREIDKIFIKKHFIHIKLTELFKSIPKMPKQRDYKDYKASYYERHRDELKQKAREHYYNNIIYYRMYNKLYYNVKNSEYQKNYYRNVVKPKLMLSKHDNHLNIERNVKVEF